MNKVLVTAVICLVLVAGVIGYFKLNTKGGSMEEGFYQGPVRPTDDLEHFRKTGETIPIRENG